MEQLSIKEQKQNAKKNLIAKIESLKQRITNLYIEEQKNDKPILYPLTQEIVILYKALEKASQSLTEELEKERQN